MTTPQTEPGKAAHALAESVRTYLEKDAERIAEAASRLQTLAGETGGINGLATWAKSAAGRLEEIEAQIRERAEGVHAAITAKKPTPQIETSVDPELADAVSKARSADKAGA